MRDSQSQALREELRRRLPAEAGFEVEQAIHVEFRDGREERIPVLIVEGNGVSLRFFERRLTNPLGASKP